MIITVDPVPGFHDRVLRAISGTAWTRTALHVDQPAEVFDIVGLGAVPVVVVVGPDVAVTSATALAQQLVRAGVAAAVLLVTEPTNEVLRSALRAGVRDVLSPTVGDDELRSAIDRTGLPETIDSSGPGITVAVFSSKGGVGTSAIAANLAVRLADRAGLETVLLDLDVASADQSIMHGLKPSWTLQDLVDGAVGTDAESLRQVLRRVAGSTSSLLPGPLDPAMAERIAGDEVARVVLAARAIAPIVVLDTASSFDDRTLAALDAADVVVVVASLDVGALRALTVTLQTLTRMAVPDAMIRVALTRADSRAGLQASDVARTVGRDVDVRFPSSRAVVRSVNEGVPIAVSAPRSAYVKAVDELVDSVLERASPELLERLDAGSSAGWFGFGFGRGRQVDEGDTDTDRDDFSTRTAVSPRSGVAHSGGGVADAAVGTDGDDGAGRRAGQQR